MTRVWLVVPFKTVFINGRPKKHDIELVTNCSLRRERHQVHVTAGVEPVTSHTLGYLVDMTTCEIEKNAPSSEPRSR